ncbi:glycerate kinase [Actinomadura madurae]|uniref:glycerate kinase n=1 Tax=Actinomadura madurae TaxID=1993 RepID=UPI0020D1F704|nr:glycerate kinase [Actinomadura madurae]
MRVVVAPDSFKGSLSAAAVCAAVEEGVRRAAPAAEVVAVPMADGGEGTLDCFLSARAGEAVEVAATDPLGRPVKARYALSGDGTSAVVELAAASGLPLVEDVPPDPMSAATTGTGELIADAVRRGARDVLVCIGGSASTDGGRRAAARPRRPLPGRRRARSCRRAVPRSPGSRRSTTPGCRGRCATPGSGSPAT